MSDAGPHPEWEGTRLTYDADTLDEAGAPPEPFPLVRRWLDDAVAAGVPEPTAMTIATVDDAGRPAARVVLLRRLEVELGSLVFFTNYESAKARQLAARPAAAAVLSWLDLHRQVRVVGRTEQLDEAASDAYFAGRPRGSQLAAWASPQSEVIADRAELEARVEEVSRRFEGREVTRPAHWGGYRLVADEVELWQGRPSRLHDRLRYVRDGDRWRRTRLAP